MTEPTGYLNPSYAQSLAEFGDPIELPRSGGWILRRAIPGSHYFDAMGCYPLFACQDEAALQQDMETLDPELVSVSLVIDPFIGLTPDQLKMSFPDRLILFKKHYVLDLSSPPRQNVQKKARQSAASALKTLSFEVCPHPLAHLDDWMRLYGCLIERYNLQGIRQFSRLSFVKQMQAPGFLMTRVVNQGRTIAMLSWYGHRNTAYAHLIGLDEEAYQLFATYALFWGSIQYFVGKVRWLDFGGVPGHSDSENDGFAIFKRKWSSETRLAYFGGRILRPDVYGELVRKSNIQNNQFFPVYRSQL